MMNDDQKDSGEAEEAEQDLKKLQLFVKLWFSE